MERRKFFKVILGGSAGAGVLMGSDKVPKLELQVGSIIRISFGRGEGLGLTALVPLAANVTYFSLRRNMLEEDGVRDAVDRHYGQPHAYKPGPAMLAFRYTTVKTPFKKWEDEAYSVRAVQVGMRFDEYRVVVLSKVKYRSVKGDPAVLDYRVTDIAIEADFRKWKAAHFPRRAKE